MTTPIAGTYSTTVELGSGSANPTTIVASSQLNAGLETLYPGLTVVNAGAIAGPQWGAYFFEGGSLTNQSGGTISGNKALLGRNGGVTVVNAGSITGGASYGNGATGVYLTAGGSVTNQTGGVISGYEGIFDVDDALTVVNAGSIAGSTSRGGLGILLFAGGSVTNQSAGTISGFYGIYTSGAASTVVNAGSITAGYVGVELKPGGSITNQSGGTISGGYAGIRGRSVSTLTVVNAGTIAGSQYAVKFTAGSASRLIADPGAVFTGAIYGGGGVLELAASASAGTLSGFGTSITGFGTLQFDAGAAWTIAGTDSTSGLGTIAITGFAVNDTIDLAGFAAVSDSFANNALVLTDAGGAQATLAVAGSFTSGDFLLSGDGNGGTDISLDVLAGTYSTLVTLGSGSDNPMTIAATGQLNDGLYMAYNGLTVVNAGSIVASTTSFGSAGVILSASGTVTNQSAGTISGFAGIHGSAGAVTVVNGGSIAGSPTSPSGSIGAGVRLDAGGSVTNQSGGRISGYFGIFGANGAVTVVNAGTLAGGMVGVFVDTGSVTNQSGGSIRGGSGDAIFGHTGAITVVNAGSITTVGGYGVDLAAGGSVTNQSGGAISGYGGILGHGYGDPVTVVNAGSIAGAGSFGIVIEGSGSITNQSGGTISASFDGIYGGNSSTLTVVNAGTIAGSSYAVKFAAGSANQLIADPGAVFTGAIYGGGGVLELAASASAGTLSGFGTSITDFGTLQFDSGAAWTILGNDSTNGLGTLDITGFADNDTIDLSGFVAVSDTFANNILVLTDLGGAQDTLNVQGAFTSSSFQLSGDGNGGTDVVVCFCAGTQIGTPTGEVPVEKLTIGDRVLTAHNGPRTVKWIGHGKVLATRGRRSAATPVIVSKGALADNVPNRDLHVTKAHSLYIDDVLIPVEFLVNHRTILWDDRAQEVEIYHVELDSHDVLIANGAPAESYRDDGNRWLFHNANAGWHLPPQDPYAPVLTGGPVVDAAWRRLLDRAGPRTLPPLTEDPDLHLVIDGVRVEPEYRRGSLYGFRLPCNPTNVVIASRTGVPSELGIARDPRSLGVALRQVAVRQGAKFMLFDAADERLTVGFHAYEADCNLRWTDGGAALPAAAFARFDQGAEVMLHLGGATQYPHERASPARAAA